MLDVLSRTMETFSRSLTLFSRTLMTETGCRCKCFTSFTCFQIFLLSSLQKQPKTRPVNLTPLMSSSPIRVTESSRNYGYNPSPVKPEGLRRPPSKTSMHQSRRLMASAQPNPDVSGLSQAVPYPASCFRVCVKECSSRVKSVTIYCWTFSCFSGLGFLAHFPSSTI